MPEVSTQGGAEGGTRTHTPLRETDFKSAASTSPLLYYGKLLYGRRKPTISLITSFIFSGLR